MKKEILEYLIAEKQKELERFRNREADILADIESFRKSIVDIAKEAEIPPVVTK